MWCQGLSTSGPQSSGVGGAFVHHCPFCPHLRAWNTEFLFVLCRRCLFYFYPLFRWLHQVYVDVSTRDSSRMGAESIFTWEVAPHTDAKRHGLLLS